MSQLIKVEGRRISNFIPSQNKVQSKLTGQTWKTYQNLKGFWTNSKASTLTFSVNPTKLSQGIKVLSSDTHF